MLLEASIKGKIKSAFKAGTLQVKSVSHGIPILSFVTDVLRHHTPHKNLYEVEVPCGKVSVTGDHSLFLYNDDASVTPILTDRIRVGDMLAVVIEDKLEGATVLSISVLPPSLYTYDLSVPGPENFVLANGLLAHNSYSIGGISLDLDRSSKYEGAYQAVADQFDKQLEKAKLTVNIVKGLQQPRFGMGIRSAFGPAVGRGVLSPRKFIGF